MKKIIFFAVAIFVVGTFFLFNTEQVNAVKPSDFGLKEGDLISAIFSDDPDVYIINDQGYKRLFLNPEIFKFYGHLGGFVNVRLVTPEIRDAFITSGLFRNCEDNDQKVYGVDIEGEDSGELHWVNSSGEQAVKDDPDFFKKVFCINSKEFNWYPRGNVLNTVKDVPKYERMETKEAISTERKLETNTPLKEEGKVVICHYPPEAPNKFQEITIDVSALKEHLSHRDTVGVCPSTPQLSQPIYVTPVPTGETMSTLYSITNVSPSGGETWTTGSVQYIKWSGNVPITHKIMTIRLRDSAGKGGAEYNLLTDTINDGLEQIIVPATLAAGYYTLEIKTFVNGQTVLGRSNSPFSIVAPASALLPTSADFTPPIISNIKVVQGETTANSACVNFYWGTNEPSKSTLVYAASPLINQTYFSASSYNNYTTSHNLNGCDLSFNTPYYFKFYSTDVAGNTVESGEQMFTPTPTPASTPMPISVSAPTPIELVDSFARCLTIKGAVMYGVSMCPYCQKQKDLFGESFKYINYVECSNNTQNTQLCQEKGITVYPTWIIPNTNIPNGNQLQGIKDFVTLSKYSGCNIPAPTSVPTPTPSVPSVSIAVVSPNGGEVFQKGTTQLIKWNSANVSKIYIKLRKGNDTYPGPEGMITDVISNVDGYYKWTIPTTLPDGNDYAIRIIDGNFTGLLDDSDAPFSLVSVATQTPVPTATPTAVPTSAPTVLPPGAECKPGETKDYTCSDGTIIPLWGRCADDGKWYYDEQMWAIAWAAGSLKDPVHDIAKVCPAPGDITPPVISNIRIAQDNQPLVGIIHDTDELAYSWLEYGLTTSYGYKTQPDTRLKASQHVNLISTTILKSNTTYHYRVVVKDLKGNTAYSGDNTFTTTAPTTQSNFLRNLTMGSTGNDVKQLQALLVNEVSYPADLLTGYFGRITRDAVKRLQEKYGVRPISGYFGEITRRALNALISN